MPANFLTIVNDSLFLDRKMKTMSSLTSPAVHTVRNTENIL